MDPKKLKVAELRSELESRGLSTEGLKSALVDRLQEFFDNDVKDNTSSSTAPESTEVEPVVDQADKMDEDKEEAQTKSPAKKSPKKKRGRSSSNADKVAAVDEVEKTSVTQAAPVSEKPVEEKPVKKTPPPVPPPPLKHQKATAPSNTSNPSEASSTSSSSSAPPPPPPPQEQQDLLMKLAHENWSQINQTFNSELVSKIYTEELSNRKSKKIGENSNQRRGYGETLALLESSSYLENYLWPHFSSETANSKHHLFSILIMINAKVTEGVPAFDFLKKSSETSVDKFALFFKKLAALSTNSEDWALNLTWKEKTDYIVFFIHVFSCCFEESMVSSVVMKTVSLPTWFGLSANRLFQEFEEFPLLKRHWQHLLAKKNDSEDGSDDFDSTFIPSLVTNYLATLDSFESKNENDMDDEDEEGGEGRRETKIKPNRDQISYMERFLELVTDLLSQLHTRRFLRTLFDDKHILERTSLSESCHLGSIPQLLEKYKFYLGFEIQDQTGEALSDSQVMTKHLQRVHILQRIAFKYYSESPFKNFAFLSTSAVGQRDELSKHLSSLPDDVLRDIGSKAKVIPDNAEDMSRELVLEVLLNNFSARESQVVKISELPLYPDETLLWEVSNSDGEGEEDDDDAKNNEASGGSNVSSLAQSEGLFSGGVPMGSYRGDRALALPKLNLQFLTFQDYLLRAFQLFRLEAAYEIRSDITDTVSRMIPKSDPFGACYFRGWARMGCKIDTLSVTEVSKPNLGEKVPALVTADITVNLSNFKDQMRAEWEELREHDVLFLVSIHPPSDLVDNDDKFDENGNARKRAKNQNQNGSQKRGDKKGNKRKDDWVEVMALKQKLGIQAVRGCEVYGMVDEEGVELNDPLKPDTRKTGRKGDTRTIKIRLDPAQYHKDMKNGVDVYSSTSLNVLVRRHGKENNFKAVLETIRDLMNTAAVGKAVPSWLHDLFLGYGDPNAAHYKSMALTEKAKAAAEGQDDEEDGVSQSMDFRDTFLDVEHVKESFPNARVELVGDVQSPPYRLTFSTAAEGGGSESASAEVVSVESYTAPNPGPYPQDQPKMNAVKFTPVQTEAIRSGMSRGLTMVVGPPGTGKTDVAVQIIANLYHNHPNEKTLIVTHSNSALNDLFCKIMERDVLERHLLRLGSGVEKLSEFTEGRDFSKFGRVNFTLSRRQELLSEVQRLADSLKIDSGDVGYTCEGAAFFHLYHVTSRMEKFQQQVKELNLNLKGADSTEDAKKTKIAKVARGSVQALFPFNQFFSDAPQDKMWAANKTEEEDLNTAMGCFRHLNKVFEELADFRAFELLRNHRMRSNYLLLKQARIVAMTCTHAAITRKQLVELGFRYDNLIMEESAQVLEVESVIPMMLQQANDSALGGQARLQRVCLIGDHHQLPPVVKNMVLQKYSKLDQTLFTRFIRLGVPHVLLNQQGRTRPDMAKLFSWRYGDLGDLPCVQQTSATAASGSADASAVAVTNYPPNLYQTANAGFAHTFQFIDVPDFMGRGESAPTAYFYQNLGEAEYVVATYQYMRLIGYPASRISIITTYNGQKHLIRDVLQQRCSHPFYGQPARVTTVDKYQGQQNDYILLSLVKTGSVGHLRDVRRLVVALSRARLGLYVFGRQSVFQKCQELKPSFDLLLQKPTELQLVLGEQYPYTMRKPNDSLEGVVSKDNEAAVHTLEKKNAVTELGTITQSMLAMVTQEADKTIPGDFQNMEN